MPNRWPQASPQRPRDPTPPLLPACSLKEYERQAWVLSGWGEVFVNAVHGQVSNLFLSLCQQLLAVAQLQAPPNLGSAVTGSARSTVESAAPFAALQRRPTLTAEHGGEGEGGGAPLAPPQPPLLLLLCRLCRFAEAEAVGVALVLLQQLYPERLLSGGEELPAFQATELGRQVGRGATWHRKEGQEGTNHEVLSITSPMCSLARHTP